MSFWNKSPGPSFKHYIKSIFSRIKEPEFLESVPGPNQSKWNIRRALDTDIPQIVRFWRDHFRRPLSPMCVYDEADLIAQIHERDFILLVARGPKANDIYGTIMAQPLGKIKRVGVSSSWSPFEVHWIDMYCVHPSQWHKGLGSALLHAIVNEGAEACIFLKEGEPLKNSMPALRSSFYMYRYVAEAEESSTKIQQWSPIQLLTLAQSFPIGIKTPYFIHENAHTDSVVFAYNGFRGTVVAVFNKGHEVNYETNERIIWCTGILHTGSIMDAENNEAMLQLSAAASRHFNSPWVWMDGKHVRPQPSSPWRTDGTYHLYGFHFDSGIYFNADPILIL